MVCEKKKLSGVFPSFKDAIALQGARFGLVGKTIAKILRLVMKKRIPHTLKFWICVCGNQVIMDVSKIWNTRNN